MSRRHPLWPALSAPGTRTRRPTLVWAVSLQIYPLGQTSLQNVCWAGGTEAPTTRSRVFSNWTWTPTVAKAYVEPSKAIVNSRGSVVISTNVAKEDAKLIADEKKGFRSIYNNKEIRRTKAAAAEEKERERAAQLEEAKRPETDILGSSETYGLS